MTRTDRIEFDEKIRPREIVEELEESYLDYAMSVIIGRAIPSVKDGLKVIHRRIIYSMFDAGYTSNKPTNKSAKIVGEVMGKFHPHGDAAIYDALVRLAQPWSIRYPLIEGQGNFGSIDGDEPAAMRYTEVRLSPLAEYLMRDIRKRTVDFVPTFDGKELEPVVLPALLPILLMNGTEGIAVGMATRIPPHNLNELVNACKVLIQNPKATNEELLRHVTGPDFPTGGLILGTDGITKAYTEGRGTITIRGRASVEQDKRERFRIVITEVPYQINKSALVEKIAELASQSKGALSGISDIRDESDRTGIRVVLELKRDANPQVILNNLYKYTPLQTTYGIIQLALVDGVPKALSLKDILELNINHGRIVLTKRIEFELEQAEKRAHVLEGFKIVLDNLDVVIKIIRSSADHKEASNLLIARFKFTEEQVKAILDMRLSQLTNLERKKVLDELAELKKSIKEFKSILSTPKKIDEILIEELEESVKRFGDERRTTIVQTDEKGEFKEEDLVRSESVVVTISRNSYIKRVPLSSFRVQARGGRGLIGAGLKSDDAVSGLVLTNTLDTILCFTNRGNVYSLKVYKIPAFDRTAKGTPIVNCIGLGNPEERVTAIASLKEFSEPYLFMCTRKGRVKKCALSEFTNLRITGKRSITLEGTDTLEFVIPTSGKDTLIISTRKGFSVCFNEGEVKPVGTSAQGVIGIRLQGEDDEVVGLGRIKPSSELLVVSELGYGKRTPLSEFRITHRATKGIISMKVREKTGDVISARVVSENDEVILISVDGMVIRTEVRQISQQGRSTMGVKVMNLREGDKVSAVEVVPSDFGGESLFEPNS